MTITLTVFFEEPFWVGLFERVDGGSLTVCKAVFGAQPSDVQVFEWLNECFFSLGFSPPVDGVVERPIAANPKRRQRQAAKAQTPGVGTKSQQALQMQREESKQARKERTKEQREADEQRRLDIRSEKKKAKHRGH